MTSQGAGIEGVEMNLEGITKKKAITNSSGYFEFTFLLSEDYTLFPYKLNYIFTPSSRTYKPLNSNKYDQNFTSLPHLYKVDPPYGPVKSVVHLAGNGFGSNDMIQIDFGITQTIATCNANTFGEFSTFFEVDSQSLGIQTITARGLYSHLIATSLFSIIPPYSISGFTKDASGYPISGIQVTLISDEGTTTTISDKNGKYMFNNLLVKAYTITAGDSFSPKKRVYSPLNQSLTNQNFYIISNEPNIWSFYQRDLKHSGRSPYNGFPYPSIKWGYNLYLVGAGEGSKIQPVIGYDGTIYIGRACSNAGLVAINPDGRERWIYDGMMVESTAAIGQDGCIYVVGYTFIIDEYKWNHYLYAIWPDGSLRWTLHIGMGGDDPRTAPVISEDGTIYIANENGIFYAVDSEGSVKWSYNAGFPIYSPAAIGDDGTIYVAVFGNHIGGDGELLALTPDGKLKWRYVTETQITASSPAIDNDGRIYVGTWYKLYCINPDGTEGWKFSCGGVWNPPTFGDDGTVYLVSDNLYAIDQKRGILKWSYHIPYLRGGAVIDPDGIIYISSCKDPRYEDKGGYLYAFDTKNRRIIWRYETDIFPPFSPVISSDKTIYFIARKNWLYATRLGGPYNISGYIEPDSKEILLNENIVENVFLTLSGDFYATYTTGETGFFRFGNIPFGTYTITPRKEGYTFEPQSRTYNPLYYDFNDEGFIIKHSHPYRIRGKIFSTKGDPIENIKVVLSGPSLSVSTITSYGRYEFGGLSPGLYTIRPDSSHWIFSPSSSTIRLSFSSYDEANFIAYLSLLSPWPSLYHDSSHAGRSPYNGPVMPKLEWTIKGTEPFTSILIGSGNTIYAVSSNTLYSILPSGSILWSFSTKKPILPSSAISQDGTIYILSDGLYGISPDGTYKWEYPVTIDIRDETSLTIGDDGTIYLALYSGFYAVNPDGSLKWKRNGYYLITPSIGRDRKIYTVWMDEYSKIEILCLKDMGTESSVVWSYDIKADWLKERWINTFVISHNGYVYLGLKNKVWCFYDDGRLKWINSSLTGKLNQPPAVGRDGSLYISASSFKPRDMGKIYSLSPDDGSVRWEYLKVGVYGGFRTPLVIDGEGRIYVGSLYTIFAFDPDYGFMWQASYRGRDGGWFYDSSFTSPFVISSDGRLYVATKEGYWGEGYFPFLYAIGSHPGPPKIKITPDPVVVQAGGGTRVYVRVEDGEGKPIPDGTLLDWRTTYGAVHYFEPPKDGTGSVGYRAPVRVGKGTITAYLYGGEGPMSKEVVVEVIPGNLAKIIVFPDVVELLPGSMTEFTCQGYDRYLNPISDLSYTWSIEEDIGSIFPNKGTKTTFKAIYPGIGKIKAEEMGISGYTIIVVMNENGVIITSNPASGYIGSNIEVRGAGFGKKEGVVINFGGVFTITTGVTDDNGIFSVVFTIPELQGGTILISCFGLSSKKEAVSYFYLFPSILLSPRSGCIGMDVFLYGKAFSGNENVKIDFGTHLTVSFPKTDGAGKFSSFFIVPSQPEGTVVVKGVGVNSGLTATETFIIQKPLSLNGYIRKFSDEPISNVFVHLFSDIPSRAEWTDVNGYYNFVVPPGRRWGILPHKSGYCFFPTERIIDYLVSDFSNCNFTGWYLNDMGLSVSPKAGFPGDWVTVDGGIYKKGEAIRIDFGRTPSIELASSNNHGLFSISFKIDTQEQGTKVITALGLSSGSWTTGVFVILPYLPNIIVKKTCDKKFVALGGTITYAILYQNTGSSTATDVTIIEVLPKKTKLIGIRDSVLV